MLRHYAPKRISIVRPVFQELVNIGAVILISRPESQTNRFRPKRGVPTCTKRSRRKRKRVSVVRKQRFSPILKMLPADFAPVDASWNITRILADNYVMAIAITRWRLLVSSHALKIKVSYVVIVVAVVVVVVVVVVLVIVRTRSTLEITFRRYKGKTKARQRKRNKNDTTTNERVPDVHFMAGNEIFSGHK